MSPGHYTHEYLVLADGPIKKRQDLKGKVVASNAAGSAVDVAMRAMLRKNGLEDKRDYTVLETPFPTMRAMLAEKKVDLIPAVLPFSLDPELRKIARPLFLQRDAIGETEMIIWAVRKPFIDKNRAAMVDFMEDTLRIVRWYLDPANQQAAAEIAAKRHQAAGGALRLAVHQKDYYRDPNMLPNLEALQRNLDMTTDLGFVKGKVDVDQAHGPFHRQGGGGAVEVEPSDLRVQAGRRKPPGVSERRKAIDHTVLGAIASWCQSSSRRRSERHRLDQDVADHRDLDDAGEHAARIGEARGVHHGAAEAIAAHQHLGHDGDDERDRQRHLQPGHDLRQRGGQHDLPEQFALAGAHVARRPEQMPVDALDADDGRRDDRERSRRARPWRSWRRRRRRATA